MMKKYIIITPAKNEEKFIERTITSVINQTILPLRWVIVDDGSTDSTAAIVKRYIDKYDFIKLVQKEKDNSRNFGSKVYAIRKGFEEVEDLEYDYYCNLDADVSFEQNYFEYFLTRFSEHPKLGICGGKVYDLINNKFIPQSYENHSVAGPVQFFRKECYESFGGYQAFKSGFIDGHAEISARMNGWETRTFPEIKVKHFRPAGTAKGSKLKVKFIGGKFEYQFGYSYIYHLIRSINSFRQKPFILGGLFSIFGYLSCVIKKEKRLVDNDFINFIRKEQSQRLKKKLGLYLNLVQVIIYLIKSL
jgi:glycosyltransferase involved in cell wall biosynthesis